MLSVTEYFNEHIKQRSKPVIIVSVMCFQSGRYFWKVVFPG